MAARIGKSWSTSEKCPGSGSGRPQERWSLRAEEWCTFLPIRPGMLMVLARGCYHLILGVTMGHKVCRAQTVYGHIGQNQLLNCSWKAVGSQCRLEDYVLLDVSNGGLPCSAPAGGFGLSSKAALHTAHCNSLALKLWRHGGWSWIWKKGSYLAFTPAGVGKSCC